jgi:hypothetical protein
MFICLIESTALEIGGSEIGGWGFQKIAVGANDFI